MPETLTTTRHPRDPMPVKQPENIFIRLSIPAHSGASNHKPAPRSSTSEAVAHKIESTANQKQSTTKQAGKQWMEGRKEGTFRRKKHLGREHLGRKQPKNQLINHLLEPVIHLLEPIHSSPRTYPPYLENIGNNPRGDMMEAAALCSLFSSNRNEIKKGVKLFLNLLEDSRGTFRGTFY